MSNINEMNREQITIEDILAACCGTDGADNTKVGFSLDFGIYNPTTNEFDIKNSITFCNPILNITRVGETAMIDFIFESKTDAELRRMWALMQKHGKDVEEAFRAGAKNIPFMRTQIVPIVYSGRYTVTAYGPLYWVLQPEYPTGEINMLRTVFNTESVLFSENEAYDEVEMAAQLQREDAERDRMEMLAEQKRREDEEYRAERQRNLEELRRTRQDY
jgi:hypothetical protein